MCWFYSEEGTKNKSSLTKTFKSGDWDVFIHIPYSYSSVLSYSLQSSYKPKGKDNKKKRRTKKKINFENELFKQSGDAIEKDETLFQYILPANDGYYIGLENKGKSALRMKLTLEGLYVLMMKLILELMQEVKKHLVGVE